jgi:hypothetical protein
MLREQRYAAERQAELGQLLRQAASHEEAEAVRLDLAWAHDDHERATARCAELRARVENLDRRALRTHAQGALPFPAGPAGDVFQVREPGGAPDPQSRPMVPQQTRPRSPLADPGLPEAGAPGSYDQNAPHSGSYEQNAPAPGSYDQTPAPSAPHRTAPEPAPAPKQRSKRRPRGSARFAGMDVEETPEAVPVAAPAVAAPAAPSRRTPRGARFAGAAEEPEQPRSQQPLDEGAGRAVAETVETLIRLRREGRSGEAHGMLVEAAYWPPARFPLLAAALHRAGLDADWAALLWEAASLPAARLVAAADALVAAGRTGDGEQMLRQGVVRPAPEIGEAVLALTGEGRRREVRALLDAYVRMRTPEEAARSAEGDPQRLVPLLLEAARGVSEERHWDLVHALRVAGFTA